MVVRRHTSFSFDGMAFEVRLSNEYAVVRDILGMPYEIADDW